MIEQTKEIVHKFNAIYAPDQPVLVDPQALIPDQRTYIMPNMKLPRRAVAR